MKLTSSARKRLAPKQFALPEKRAYPVPDISHARNALARASGNATPEEQATIKAKVASKFPNIKQRMAPKGKKS